MRRSPLLYSGGIGSGDGVFCGNIQLCWIRRATKTPWRMVVREKDGLSAAEWSVSFSCSSTKSATIPGAGVSDIAGDPLWKPPMANRELIVTDSYKGTIHEHHGIGANLGEDCLTAGGVERPG